MSEPPASYGALKFEPLPDEQPQGGGDDDFGDLYQQLGIDPEAGEYTIKVYRYTGGRGGAWLFDLGMGGDDERVLERLRDDYGGGKFEFRVYRDGSIHKRHKVSIEAPKQPAKPQQPSGESLSASDVLGMMREMQDQQMRQMRELIDKQHQPAQQQPQPNMAEVQQQVLQNLVQMKELFGSNQPAKDPLQQVREILEFQRELGVGQGGGGEDQGLMPMLSMFAKDVIKPLADASQRPATPAQRLGGPPGAGAQGEGARRTNSTAHGQAPPRQRTPPPPPPSPNAPAATPGDQHEDSPMQKQLQGLCLMAHMTAPQTAGDMILEKASDAEYEALAEIVSRDDCIDQLAAIHPDVAAKREWFERLRTYLLAELMPGEDEHGLPDEDDSGTTPTNNDNNDDGGAMEERRATQPTAGQTDRDATRDQ